VSGAKNVSFSSFNKRAEPDKEGVDMNARERCRARRHARRADERAIIAATGANYRGGSIQPLYNAGHRKSKDIVTAR